MVGLNLGSGQRRFDSSKGWINIDSQSVPPDRVPDLQHDLMTRWPFEDNSVDYCVFSQVVEHFGCGVPGALFTEAYRVLKPGGVMIVTVPDLRALAQRWLTGQIDDFIYSVNLYGAYMGDEADRHKWNTSFTGWADLIARSGEWSRVRRCAVALREIEGMDLARDWWIMEIEAIK